MVPDPAAASAAAAANESAAGMLLSPAGSPCHARSKRVSWTPDLMCAVHHCWPVVTTTLVQHYWGAVASQWRARRIIIHTW
jgi:hypothetical protein